MPKPPLMLVHDQAVHDQAPAAPAAAEDSPELRRAMALDLAPYGFFDAQKAEMVDAYLESQEGVRAVIDDANRSSAAGKLREPPRAVILAAIRRGDHVRHELNRQREPERRRTGYRFVYGVGHAAGTFVEDPEGRDVPPADYDLVTRQPHEPGAWRDAQTEVERRAKRTQRRDGAA